MSQSFLCYLFFFFVFALQLIILIFNWFLLAIRKNTLYKLMWWLYKASYDTTYYYDVVGYSSSDVTSGALQVALIVDWDGLPVCYDVYWFFHGWRRLGKECWSLFVENDSLYTRVHLLWFWEFWIGIAAWWLFWTCWRST